jgi:hypothetical protein
MKRPSDKEYIAQLEEYEKLNQAEIERLRASAKGHRRCEENMDAEIERLEAELATAKKKAKNCSKQYNRMKQHLTTEIEQLRTELNLLDAARTEKLIDELRTENERLRKANEWLRELVTTKSCPTCAALLKEDDR